MQFGEDRRCVGRKQGAPERRFPWPLAVVLGLFLFGATGGTGGSGASLKVEVSNEIEISAKVALSAKMDLTAVRPLGATCQKDGSTAHAAATHDPDKIARSTGVRDNRRAAA